VKLALRMHSITWYVSRGSLESGNHIFGIADPTIPIHYITFMELRWRLGLRVVYSWASPLLIDFRPKINYKLQPITIVTLLCLVDRSSAGSPLWETESLTAARLQTQVQQVTFSSTHLQVILARDGSNDAFSPKEVPFGVKKLKLTLNPFYAPKGQFFAKKWT